MVHPDRIPSSTNKGISKHKQSEHRAHVSDLVQHRYVLRNIAIVQLSLRNPKLSKYGSFANAKFADHG